MGADGPDSDKSNYSITLSLYFNNRFTFDIAKLARIVKHHDLLLQFDVFFLASLRELFPVQLLCVRPNPLLVSLRELEQRRQ